MALLKLLLSLGTIIAVTAFSTFGNLEKNLSAAINHRLSDNIKPTHYNIEFILNIEEGIYHGKSNVNITISEETQHIELHSINWAITETTLINKDVRQSQKNKELIYKPSHYSYNKEINIFIIHFSNKLLPGNYILNVEFFSEATNDIKGLFRTSYNNKKGHKVWLFATHLQAVGARQLFPCWDKPELKATFTISIKHSIKYRAFSNMPMLKQKFESNMMWTYFHTTPIMSPNLVAIAVINFISMSNNWNVKIWHREFKEKERYKFYTYNFTRLFMMTLKNDWYMMTSKMFPKIDYIAIPDFPERVAITWGLVIYREVSLNIIDDELSSLEMTHNKMEVLRFIAYTVAQESLNNMSPWFTEGFAQYLEIYIIDKNLESYRMMNRLAIQIQHESFRLNSYFNEINNYEINSLPSSFRYNKAFCILRMVQYLLTDEVFREGIKNYLYANASNRTTPNNFWIAMQNALNKSSNENKTNLVEKMDGWTKQNNYPILKIRCMSFYINVLLQNPESFDSKLWIPMTFTTQKDSDFNRTSLHDVTWLKLTSENSFSANIITYFENEWIIVNLQRAGYYRVNYDSENWERIAKYLNSMEYTKIHVLNRAQIIDDAFYFLTLNQISSSIFWELASYLARETDYVAWYPMIKAFEHMSSVFPLSDPQVRETERIKRTFNKLLENIGYEESYEDDENYFINSLRQEVTKWACLLDDIECKKVAGFKLQQHLANRTANKLLPWWEEWTYCNGLTALDNNAWNDIYKIYMKEPDNKYLKFLACSENIVIIKSYSSLILEGNDNGAMKNKDRVNSFHYIIAKHAKNSKMLDYILANFEKITSRQMRPVALITNLINHVYSKEQLHKIYQYVKSYMKSLKLHVKHKIKKRLLEITNITNYLRKLFNPTKIKHV